MAAASGEPTQQEKLALPLLEEGAEYSDNDVRRVVIPYAARLLRIGAKLLAKACGVAIAWSWADAIHSTFSEKLVPPAFTAFTGILYACAMTLLTTYMVKYIAEGAGDPDNIEYGQFGAHSRELLLIVQPMMLAWAWKDALRDALWQRLPQDSMVMLLLGRLAFAVLATMTLSWVIKKLGDKIEEQKRQGEDGTYTTVALSLLSAAFSLFLAWCWNAVANTLGEAISSGKTATAFTTTLYAAGVTLFASWATTQLSQKLREFTQHASPDDVQPMLMKFIDLIEVSLGYVVGWAWSDAAVNVLMEAFTFTDMKMLYLVYAVGITVAAIVFTYHMASVIDDPDTPILMRQYMTLLLNALALMTGWAWKAYIQYFVKMLPAGGGRIVSNYFQAVTMTLIACFMYHKICLMAKAELSAAQEKIVDKQVEKAANQMD